MSYPKEQNQKYCKDYKLEKRTACLALYGSVCKHCGFSDTRALQIDHINSKPAEKKDQYGRGSTGLYIAILKGLKNKNDYQCLCANCNWIKRHGNPLESTKNTNVSN